MKTTSALLLSAALLGLASAPSAHAGFLGFGRGHVDVVVQAPAPPVIVTPEICVEKPVVYAPRTVVVVPRPPSPIVERHSLPPRPGYVGMNGYWNWNNHDWVWVRGHWAPAPYPRAVYVPGHWTRYHGHGYRFVPGYWR